jgi:spore coat polysaccharide biosynthesis protein SpsF
MQNKTVAVIQARMGSSRLPGKVMMKINEKPILSILLDRLSHSQKIDEIVVATSINKENDIIESFCKENNYHCFRGSENDVLGRMLEALDSRDATTGVEVFGDCPLIDHRIVDDLIHKFNEHAGELDFIGNDLKTTYPPGMEVEVFNIESLRDASLKTQAPEIREHGTLFIRQNPKLYKIKNIEAPEKFNFPNIELELDTEEDFVVITKIIENFLPNLDFSLEEILHFLQQNKHLILLNSDVPRRWKDFREDTK